MTLIGAAVSQKPGESMQQAIGRFESTTGRVMPVRRSYDSGVPASLSASKMSNDVGVRKSVWSFKPSISTPIAALEALAKSIAKARHPCDVIIYHEPVDNMTGPDFVALYRRSAWPFRHAGIPVGVCYTNWSCNLPYSNAKSALRNYWPGDGIVDFIAIDEYPVGEITATKDAMPMNQRTRRVCQFADARKVPVGLAEYGVDGSWDLAKGERWLRSVAAWAAGRAAERRPPRWLCYFNSNVGGNYWLANKSEYVDAYVDAYRLLS